MLTLETSALDSLTVAKLLYNLTPYRFSALPGSSTTREIKVDSPDEMEGNQYYVRLAAHSVGSWIIILSGNAPINFLNKQILKRSNARGLSNSRPQLPRP